MAACTACFHLPVALSFNLLYISKFLILLLSLAHSFSEQAQVSRPRGVALSKKAFYDPDRDFNCLDGSSKVPFLYVNDDYCDCMDGSDEPGTSACPNGMFHCTNAGHQPLNIPSSRVNDGICDCCDASDEYNSSAFCRNKCKELGRQAREDAERHLALLSEGYQKKVHMSGLGKEKRQIKKDELDKVKKEVDEMEEKRKELEEAKRAAEELEKTAIDHHKKLWEDELEERKKERELSKASDVFKEFDINMNEKLSLNEIIARLEFDTDGDGIVSVEEAQTIIKEDMEIDFHSFFLNVWNSIKDKVQPKPDPIPVPKEDTSDYETPQVSPPDLEDIDKAEEAGEIEDDFEEKEDETTSDSPAKEEAPQDVMPDYDEPTKRLVEVADSARSELKEIEDKLRDLRVNVRNLEGFQNIDFGPDDEFAPLEGQCLDYSDRQYTYRFCMFDNISQKPQPGGSEVNLGTWGEWSGSADNTFSEMKYNQGTGCWNGPARSTSVKLRCGLENRVISVSEPNRCVYLLEMETPAMCQHPDTVKAHIHEEL